MIILVDSFSFQITKMSSNYYCDLHGIFNVVAMIGDQVDSDFEPEDLMDVQERYGGRLPSNYCSRDPYTGRRMTFRFVSSSF